MENKVEVEFSPRKVSRTANKIFSLSQNDLKAYLTDYLFGIGYKPIVGDGYVYAEGTVPVLLVAHMDTVHTSLPGVICKGGTYGEIWMSPNGIGGDDRAGVYMVTEVIRELRCSVLFCEDEETGGVGARKFTTSKITPKVNHIIEFDRMGNNDAVFYSCGNKEYVDFIERFGFKEAYGSFSDISTIAPHLGIAAVNLSSGYYSPHTRYEYVNFDIVHYNIDRAKAIIEASDTFYKYTHKTYRYYGDYGSGARRSSKYSRGNWGSYYDDEYDDADWWNRSLKGVPTNAEKAAAMSNNAASKVPPAKITRASVEKEEEEPGFENFVKFMEVGENDIIFNVMNLHLLDGNRIDFKTSTREQYNKLIEDYGYTPRTFESFDEGVTEEDIVEEGIIEDLDLPPVEDANGNLIDPETGDKYYGSPPPQISGQMSMVDINDIDLGNLRDYNTSVVDEDAFLRGHPSSVKTFRDTYNLLPGYGENLYDGYAQVMSTFETDLCMVDDNSYVVARNGTILDNSVYMFMFDKYHNVYLMEDGICQGADGVGIEANIYVANTSVPPEFVQSESVNLAVSNIYRETYENTAVVY